MGLMTLDLRGPRIRVVGCGGAGTNTVHRLVSSGLRNTRTVAVNTDRDHLARATCDRRVLLADGAVRSTGGRPDFGKRLATMHERDVRQAVCGGDLTFVIAGLGGGTGTGIAPLVARWAHSSGATAVGLVTMPFRSERNRREVALRGLGWLRDACDSIVVLDNDRLLDRVPHLPVEQAFAVMDQLIGSAIKGITEAVFEPSLIHLDFPVLREILREGGTATILSGEGDVRDPDRVAATTLDNPLLDVSTSGATGAIVNILSGPSVRLQSVHRVVDGVTREIRRDARVAFGLRTHPEFEGALRVTAILTGIDSPFSSPSVDGTPIPSDLPFVG